MRNSPLRRLRSRYSSNGVGLRMFTYTVATAFFVSGAFVSASDQDASRQDLLKKTERQLFSQVDLTHTEYRDCITHAVDACGSWNVDYAKPDDHAPSIADTLDWVGDQLRSRNLAHRFRHKECLMAIDTIDGTPIRLAWLEARDGKREFKDRSIFSTAMTAKANAKDLQGNGYTTYLFGNHRNNGSSDSPRNLTFYNDAALIDLAQLVEIKSYVGTKDNGDLFLASSPTNTLKINFNRDTVGKVNLVGAGFSDTVSVFSDGLMPFKGADKSKEMFGNVYTPFETKETRHQYILLLPNDDVDLNIKITKALLHVVALCEDTESVSQVK